MEMGFVKGFAKKIVGARGTEGHSTESRASGDLYGSEKVLHYAIWKKSAPFSANVYIIRMIIHRIRIYIHEFV